jgi:hypothetical protein
MFRPSAVYRNSSVIVECCKKKLYEKKTMILTPGEMAEVILKPDLIRNLPGNSITVRIERS